jgi:AcrR family transcriptional regulator
MTGSRPSSAARVVEVDRTRADRAGRMDRAGRVDRGGRQGGHVAEMQRRRLLTATVELALQGGIQAVSVATLCARAGVSRRTFYELFADREDCLRAAFEDSLQSATQTVARAVADTNASGTGGIGRTGGVGRPGGVGRHGGWRERVRTGLVALLCLFDQEPGTARLLVVEALAADPTTLELRRSTLEQAAMILDEGRTEARTGRQPPPLTAEGIVGAVLSVIHARLIAHDPRPLSELAGSLMALIVHPYLGSRAAQQELHKHTKIEPIQARKPPADPFKDLPIRLTYRTALVLTSIAQSPGSSSKQIADASGIADPGQISRLLTRLRTNNLIQDNGTGPTKGMARAWTLTQRGKDILQATGQV